MRYCLLAAIGALAFIASPSAAQTAPAAPPAQAMPHGNPAELPKVFAVSIASADLDRSEKFYLEGLGAVKAVKIHDRERSVQFKSGLSVVLHLVAPRAAGAPLPEGPAGFILQVSDIDALIARVVRAGGTVVRPPNDGKSKLSFGVRAAQIRDPDGVGIELIQFPAAG